MSQLRKIKFGFVISVENTSILNVNLQILVPLNIFIWSRCEFLLGNKEVLIGLFLLLLTRTFALRFWTPSFLSSEVFSFSVNLLSVLNCVYVIFIVGTSTSPSTEILLMRRSNIDDVSHSSSEESVSELSDDFDLNSEEENEDVWNQLFSVQ